jgi:hypothetical protein
VADGEACPKGISLTFNPYPSTATREKNLKVTYTLSNKSKYDIDSSVVVVDLGDGVSYSSGSHLKQFGSGSSSRPVFNSTANTLTWTNAGGAKATKKFQAGTKVGR